MRIKDPKLIQIILISVPILCFLVIASSWTYIGEKLFLLGILIVCLVIGKKTLYKYEQAQLLKLRSGEYIFIVSTIGILWTLGCLFFAAMDNHLIDRKLIGGKLFGAIEKFHIDETNVQLVEFGLWSDTVIDNETFSNSECVKILINDKEKMKFDRGEPYLLKDGEPYLHRDCEEKGS